MRVNRAFMFALLFLSLAPASAQGQTPGQKRAPAAGAPSGAHRCPRPAIEVLPAAAGTTLKLRALLDGKQVRPGLSFDWTAAAGVIIAGQAEPVVTIEAHEPNFDHLIVTLTIGGLASHCPATISFSPLPPITCALPLDTYGTLDPEDEKARLDNFAIALLNEPKTLGYIIVYGGRRGRRGEAQAGVDRAKLYLVNERDVDAGRIVTIDGGFRDELTFELIIVPPMAAPPNATPTVDERDVVFTDDPS